MSPPQDAPCDVAAAAVVVSSDHKSHHDGCGSDDDVDRPAQPPSAVPDNNPSRPAETTYCVLLPVHELDGGVGGGGHDDRADDRPRKKRPATSGSCSAEDDDSSPTSLPPKKRKVVDYCVDSLGSNGGRNRETPAVTRHGGGGAPVGSTAMELHRRAIKFGKRKVTVELEAALTVPTTAPPMEKLMHDGIRAAAAATLRLLPPPKRRIMHVPPPSPAAAMNGQLHNDIVENMSVELRERLDALGATPPRYVCKKSLKRSDVDLNQNRLLISCKREEVAKCPITHLFTEEERIIVNKKPDEPKETRKKRKNNNDDEEKPGLKVKKKKNNNKNKNNEEKPGLKVTMLDHGGDRYATTCRYLTSNGGYRFIGEWGKFLRRNGLAVSVSRGEEWTRSVHVRLLEFRSRRLPQADKSGHPDGALGFIVLHGDDSDSDDNEDDQCKRKAPPPANAKKKKKSNSREHVKATSSSKSAAAALKREVTAERVTRRSVEQEADDDDERMRGALNGMLKLSEGSPRRSKDEARLETLVG